MKKKLEPSTTTTVTWPFDEYHQPYRCDKCHRLLRYSAVYQRVYIVSETGDGSEIIRKNHDCFKDLANGRGGKIR